MRKDGVSGRLFNMCKNYVQMCKSDIILSMRRPRPVQNSNNEDAYKRPPFAVIFCIFLFTNKGAPVGAFRLVQIIKR